VPPARTDIDETDLALLRLLSADARISRRQLATQLGVSAPTVGERLGRLEAAGVIQAYSAQIGWEAIGYGVQVYLSISAADGCDVAEIMRQLWTVAEVEAISVVTGRLDLLARLRVRDQRHLRALLMDRVWQIPGVRTTETMISMAEMPPKPFAAGLLADLAGGHAPVQLARAQAGQGTRPRRPRKGP